MITPNLHGQVSFHSQVSSQVYEAEITLMEWTQSAMSSYPDGNSDFAS